MIKKIPQSATATSVSPAATLCPAAEAIDSRSPNPALEISDDLTNGISQRLSRALSGMGRSITAGTASLDLLEVRSDGYDHRESVKMSPVWKDSASHATLAANDLALVSITPEMRYSKPLCGAVLDGKYLLIGTSTSLEFLPMPLPGSFSTYGSNGSGRAQLRRPVPLIRQTSFREMAILSDRSNILVAIAGKNEHVRVYALAEIRSLIEQKMRSVVRKNGYPFDEDTAGLRSDESPNLALNADRRSSRISQSMIESNDRSRRGTGATNLIKHTSLLAADVVHDPLDANAASRSQLQPRSSRRHSMTELAKFLRESGPEDRVVELAARASCDVSNRPSDYFKLAHTRGARLIRAVETDQRTYVAVLCGDEGERIELFTGARLVSLSLNRTFVLPETPRDIELQLQGDDLVDIYLIYDDKIFAVEPDTIRVREVGVGRRSRASSRERIGGERPGLGPVPTSAYPSRTAVGSCLSDVAEATNILSSADRNELAVRADSLQNGLRIDEFAASAVALRNGSTSQQSCCPRRASPARARYSTFSQLPFIPPLPSGVLSSSWTIPPLYSDVIAGVTDQNLPVSLSARTPESPRTVDRPEQSLLSPVSLLDGAALRDNVRPGLFFVTRSDISTGIVTRHGKSIMKNLVRWVPAQLDVNGDSVLTEHIQLLVVGGKTLLVKLNYKQVQVAPIEDASTAARSSCNATVVAPASPQTGIRFLSTHHADRYQQLLFAETAGQTWTVRCLTPRAIPSMCTP
ncbi:uncharacterized protein JCM15063_003681 [Sporobolomyces koalae]|uniref:uncharacterized protein n=1 Tax=Sporobolomyces koalae TaxID=500713 RepID=UPI00316C2FE4